MEEKEKSTSASETEETTEEAASVKKKKKLPLLILLILAAAAAVGALLYFFVFRDTPKKHLNAAVNAMLAGDFAAAQTEIELAPEGAETDTAKALLAVLVKNEVCLAADVSENPDPAVIGNMKDMQGLLTQLSEASVQAMPGGTQPLITRLTASTLILYDEMAMVPDSFTWPMTEARALSDDWESIRGGSSFTAGPQVDRWREMEKGAEAARAYYEEICGDGIGIAMADEILYGLNYMAETLEMQMESGAFTRENSIRFNPDSLDACTGADEACATAYSEEDLNFAEQQLYVTIYQREMSRYGAAALQNADGAADSAAPAEEEAEAASSQEETKDTEDSAAEAAA